MRQSSRFRLFSMKNTMVRLVENLIPKKLLTKAKNRSKLSQMKNLEVRRSSLDVPKVSSSSPLLTPRVSVKNLNL